MDDYHDYYYLLYLIFYYYTYFNLQFETTFFVSAPEHVFTVCTDTLTGTT